MSTVETASLRRAPERVSLPYKLTTIKGILRHANGNGNGNGPTFRRSRSPAQVRHIADQLLQRESSRLNCDQATNSVSSRTPLRRSCMDAATSKHAPPKSRLPVGPIHPAYFQIAASSSPTPPPSPQEESEESESQTANCSSSRQYNRTQTLVDTQGTQICNGECRQSNNVCMQCSTVLRRLMELEEQTRHQMMIAQAKERELSVALEQRRLQDTYIEHLKSQYEAKQVEAAQAAATPAATVPAMPTVQSPVNPSTSVNQPVPIKYQMPANYAISPTINHSGFAPPYNPVSLSQANRGGSAACNPFEYHRQIRRRLSVLSTHSDNCETSLSESELEPDTSSDTSSQRYRARRRRATKKQCPCCKRDRSRTHTRAKSGDGDDRRKPHDRSARSRIARKCSHSKESRIRVPTVTKTRGGHADENRPGSLAPIRRFEMPSVDEVMPLPLNTTIEGEDEAALELRLKSLRYAAESAGRGGISKHHREKSTASSPHDDYSYVSVANLRPLYSKKASTACCH